MNKITWTHVDALVRKGCEEVGMLPIGNGDAEIAYNYLKYIESKADLFQREGLKMEAERDSLQVQLRAAQTAPVRVGKTKRRLSVLEAEIKVLRELITSHIDGLV